MPPRRIRPNVTWFVTRRTTRRHFLLRPDADGTCQQLYWYTTAVLAAKFGIVLHAVQVLSTHIHEVLTDTRGNLPQFVCERNRLLANALKVHRRWPEEVFQRGAASLVELVGAHATAKEIGYTLANCVEAGLVSDPSLWPGVTTSIDDIGERSVTVQRPAIYFDPRNKNWPHEATIRLEMPPILETTHGNAARDVLRGYVIRAIDAAREAAQQAGRIVGQLHDLLNVAFHRSSQSPEPRRKRNPHFATGGDPTLTQRAREERHSFLSAYRAALDRWKKGDSQPRFPEGTWRWKKLFVTSDGSTSVDANHSTVTVFAKFLGWSTSVPLRSAMWYARS